MLQRRLKYAFGFGCLAWLVLAPAGCGGSKGGGSAGIGATISIVQGGGVAATLESGSSPSGSGPGLAASVDAAPGIITNASTGMVTISAATAFSEVAVGLVGAKGHYRLTLPAPVASLMLTITVDQDAGNQDAEFRFSVGDGSEFGVLASEMIRVLRVGMGEVQVSLAWDVDVDFDVIVREPSGEFVNVDNSPSSTGGTLDFDSNGGREPLPPFACIIDGVNSESIMWADGTSPEGRYEASILFFDTCGETASINYTVTVTVAGQSTVFMGSFDSSDEDEQRIVSLFDVF